MKHITRITLAVVVLAVALQFAFAQPAQQPQPQVILGGKILWTFRVSAGGASPMQRADACRDRSVTILSDPTVTERDVKIVIPKNPNEPQIWVGKYLFATVTLADAKVNQTTPAKLAKTWSKNLAEGLSIARVHRPEEGKG